ncbi:hypothetical protein HAX54_047031 [Datura stramonium]|uniref:Uncharacterized protein n=1 Tax=Datura stramonium TaxID=4076 RepID=A0ABS8WLJ7_DATST|nr:hypothetical protein [Datura stramonium]
MSLPSSLAFASQMTPSSALHPESNPDLALFQNPFSEISDSSLAPPVQEASTNTLQSDSSITPVDLNASLDTITKDPPVDTSADMASPVGQPDSVLLPNTSGPSLVQNDAEEGIIKKGSMETSYGYLFEEDLPMATGNERPLRSERTLSRSPSPAPKSLVLTSSPRWDRTQGNLNLQQNVENANDISDDDQPLAWKVRKLVGCQHQQLSRDQVRPPTTRGGVDSQSIISDLIASQETSTREVERLTSLFAQHDADITNMKAAQIEEPGPLKALHQEMMSLRLRFMN